MTNCTNKAQKTSLEICLEKRVNGQVNRNYIKNANVCMYRIVYCDKQVFKWRAPQNM